MKTAEEFIYELDGIFNCANSQVELVDARKRRLSLFKKHEAEIRADERETRIKELTSMGEFKTAEQAIEYCRLHGVDIGFTGNAFMIAGALMDARKDQDKITRHASIEEVSILYQAVDNSAIDCGTVTGVIMNTKFI